MLIPQSFRCPLRRQVRSTASWAAQQPAVILSLAHTLFLSLFFLSLSLSLSLSLCLCLCLFVCVCVFGYSLSKARPYPALIHFLQRSMRHLLFRECSFRLLLHIRIFH